MLNRMGYYNYQIGLIHNHLNQEGGWDSHIEHCRNFILNSLDLYKPEKVTVLGSGWLLDLPLAEIIERTGKVCLVDIVHPPDVIDQVRNLGIVELIEADVTGGLIEEVWQKAGNYSFFHRLKSLKSLQIPEFQMDSDPGLVISLNILTQLESLIVDFLKKRSAINEAESCSFRTEIQKKHIDFLKKHKSLLITDYAEVIYDKKGAVNTVPTLLTDLPSSEFSEEWTWNFDLKGNDFFTKTSVIKVIALAI
jgi:hypothetical protein